MPTPNATEYLEINSYPLANPCSRLLDLTGMWKVAYRASSETIPYVHGRLSFPTYLDELRLVLPGVLWGHVDSDGGANANPRAGLNENYEELYAAVLAPVDDGDGTRPIEWHRGDGTVWSGLVQVTNFDVRALSPRSISYSLTLAFPAGRLDAP